MDDIDTPNCPRCLQRMEPVVGAWWCGNCKLWVRPDEA